MALVILCALSSACKLMELCEDPETKGELQSGDDAMHLAEAYAPVLVTVKQDDRFPCDETFDTDPYKPTDVEAYFGESVVRLLTGRDITVEPEPVDAANGTKKSYFDIFSSEPEQSPSPFDPEDRCIYEANYATYQQTSNAPSVYARVVSTSEETALQFLFFYYLNDYINIHEGDWEMIQLLFPSGSPAEIVRSGILPERATFSQHTSGRSVPWNALEKSPADSTHPVVYVASGSHSNYTRPGFWQASVDFWLDNCDLTVPQRDPGAQVLKPQVLEQNGYPLTLLRDPELEQALVWTPYPGKWGQAHWLPGYGGTTSPMVERRGRNAWWWDGKVKQGPNERECVDRERHPRHALAEERLLEALTGQQFNVRMLIGDLVVFVVSWLGSDVSLTIGNPNGDIIGPMDPATVRYEKGKNGKHYEVYWIKGGSRGVWTVTATGRDLPDGGEPIYFRAFDLSLPCEDVDTNSREKDSDADGIPNGRDRAPCDWDENDDGISDGCDPANPGEGADTCIDPVDGSPRDVIIPTVPPITPIALATPTPP
jgi:hypothetical protein